MFEIHAHFVQETPPKLQFGKLRPNSGCLIARVVSYTWSWTSLNKKQQTLSQIAPRCICFALGLWKETSPPKSEILARKHFPGLCKHVCALLMRSFSTINKGRWILLMRPQNYVYTHTCSYMFINYIIRYNIYIIHLAHGYALISRKDNMPASGASPGRLCVPGGGRKTHEAPRIFEVKLTRGLLESHLPSDKLT